MRCVAFDPLTPGASSAARRAAQRFVEFGRRLQRADPARVPDDAAAVGARLDARHPYFSHGTARFWIVEDAGGHVTGRVAAFANEHAVDADDDGRQIGYVGMYEAIDDQSVARALLESACAWLADAHGVRRVIGPMDGSTWYSYRFSDPATHHLPALWLEPRTADHYPTQWRACGFTTFEHYVSMRTRAADEPRSGKLAGLVEAGYTFRTVDLSRWDDELGLIYEMSLAAFADNPSYTPITWDEFRALHADARRVVDPRLVHIAAAPDGAPAGFLFCVPNYAQAMLRMNGRRGLGGALAFVAHRRAARSVLVKTMATMPEHRSVGIGGALRTLATEAAIATGRTHMIQMLMHEDNHTRGMADALGGRIARRYLLLHRQLSHELRVVREVRDT